MDTPGEHFEPHATLSKEDEGWRRRVEKARRSRDRIDAAERALHWFGAVALGREKHISLAILAFFAGLALLAFCLWGG